MDSPQTDRSHPSPLNLACWASLQPRRTPPPYGAGAHAEPVEAAILNLLAWLDEAEPEQALPTLLGVILQQVPATIGLLYQWQDQAAWPLQGSACTDPSFLDEYLARFRSTDPQALANLRPAGGSTIRPAAARPPVHCLSANELSRTRFHERLLARYGGPQHGLATYASQADHHIGLRLFRSADQAPFSAEDLRRISLFQTHVLARLQRRVHARALEQANARYRSLLDSMAPPVFLLGEDARIVSRNKAAEALLRDGQRLQQTNGRLSPGSLVDHASWIRPAMHGMDCEQGGGRRSHLQALSGINGTDGRELGLLLRLERPDGSCSGTIAVILLDLHRSPAQHDPQQLCEAFGFTPTEARVANALTQGKNTTDIAAAFDIRPDTVRSHVKRLLAKTGTHRTTDLALLLLRAAPDLAPLHTIR